MTTTATREALPCQYFSFFSRPATIESVFPTPLHIPPEKPNFSPYALPTFISRGHPMWLHLGLDFQPQLPSILLAQRASTSLFRSSFTLAYCSTYFFSDFPIQSCSRSPPLANSALSLRPHLSLVTQTVLPLLRPSNPMHCEALRTATSLLCLELMRPARQGQEGHCQWIFVNRMLASMHPGHKLRLQQRW